MTDSSDKTSCPRPDLERLLGRYEFDALSAEERSLFERHVLECDACFAELERGSLAMSVLREHAESFLGVLDETHTMPAAPEPRRLPGRASVRERLRATLLRPWVVVPAAAVITLGIGILRWAQPPDYARLATFPREEMRTTALRGPATGDAVRELLDSGAGYFNLGHYDEAVRHFRAARERDPALFEAAYALGLALALAGDAQGAIPHLEKAVELAEVELAQAQPTAGDRRDRARWTLANAYLKSGDVGSARRELGHLEPAAGELAARARALSRELAD